MVIIQKFLIDYYILSMYQKVIKNKNFKKVLQYNRAKIVNKNLKTFNKSPSRLLCDGLWNAIDYENLTSQFAQNFTFLILVVDQVCMENSLKNFRVIILEIIQD